jgi:His-Xaa-Ser system protein HxsD
MGISLCFDLNVYTLDVLKRAAYRYINIFSINFEVKNNLVICALHFTNKSTADQCSYYADQYKKEVLDQDLRNTIKNETEAIRNLILAQAFSKTRLVDSE